MSEDVVEVEIEGLTEVLRDFDRFGADATRAAETRLGEMWDDFKFYLDGGRVKKPGPGNGSWAVETGTSVKDWTPKIRGFNFTATNATDYAQYVRLPKPGLPKWKYPTPQPLAVPLARKKFEALSDVAASDIGDMLQALLDGEA